jgi:predicted metal-dependent hydrolase
MFDEAESKGLGAKVAVGLEAFASAPAETLAQVGGYMIPNLAAGVLGKAAKLGKLGMTAAQAATGAAMGAGTVKGEIYRGVTDYLREQGVPEDQIDNVATEAQAYGGKNMDQILLATGIGAAAASTGVEKIFTRILTRTGGEVTDKSIASVLKNGLKGAATETAVEVPQEMQEQVATNIALQREGAEVPTFRGAVQAGAMAAPAALLLGGAAGGVEVMTAEDKAEQEINRDADKEARNLSVPEGDTSAKVVVNEINRRENAITSLQEELDTLEPADPRAQQLRLDIASLQKGKAQLKKRNKEPLTQVEEKQAELAAIIAAEPAAGLSETITQPAPPAPAPTIGEKPPTSPMIGAEPTQPAPAELYPQGTSLTESITTTKEKIGDRIPAFKVGDFFEFFGDDADLTGTTVTKRGENKMSGVPYYDQARLQEIANRTGKPVAIINRETRTVESEVAPSVPTAAPSIVSEAIRITNERKTRWEATDPQDRSATFNFVGRAEVELENLIGNLAGKENATARQNLIAEITGVKPTIQKSALKDVRQAISGYLQANPIQSLSEPSRAAIPAAPAVTTPPAPEAVTPAPEGITVGNRIKLGKSPQGYVVEEVIESTPQEKELGEQYFRVKNERTGETQVVEQKDLIQIKPKRIRAKRGQMTPLPQERQATFEDVESRVKTFFGGTIPSRVTITNNPNAPDTAKGSYDPETGIIEFNLAFIPKEDNIEDIVTHELGHFMFGDTKVKKAFDAFYNSLTPDEKAQVDKRLAKSSLRRHKLLHSPHSPN